MVPALRGTARYPFETDDGYAQRLLGVLKKHPGMAFSVLKDVQVKLPKGVVKVRDKILDAYLFVCVPKGVEPLEALREHFPDVAKADDGIFEFWQSKPVWGTKRQGQ